MDASPGHDAKSRGHVKQPEGQGHVATSSAIELAHVPVRESALVIAKAPAFNRARKVIPAPRQRSNTAAHAPAPRVPYLLRDAGLSSAASARQAASSLLAAAVRAASSSQAPGAGPIVQPPDEQQLYINLENAVKAVENTQLLRPALLARHNAPLPQDLVRAVQGQARHRPAGLRDLVDDLVAQELVGKIAVWVPPQGIWIDKSDRGFLGSGALGVVRLLHRCQ